MPTIPTRVGLQRPAVCTHPGAWPAVPVLRGRARVVTPKATLSGAATPEPASNKPAVPAEDPAVKAERKRQRALAPYLVAAPQHGIIGNSKYAERLRKQVVEAARDKDRRAVAVFGEPGLEKFNIGALIHFGGPSRTTQLAALDCATLDWSGSELFGRGDRAGLVENIGNGTVLLTNVHKLPPGLLPKLVRLCGEGTYRRAPPAGTVSAEALLRPTGPAASVDEAPIDFTQPLKRARCRVIMTSQRPVTQLDPAKVTTIKVPPLRLRPADVKDLQRYYLSRTARRQGSSGTSSPRLVVTPAALRQLESYGWPGNVAEVAQVVERAVFQAGQGAADGSGTGRLSEEVFWFAKQAKDRFRLNLLAAYPPLRRLLRSEVWPDAINFKFTAIVYPIVVALLLLGPQDRAHSPSLAVFWDYWWPLVFVSYPFLGRVWCAVCPFMIYGELMQKWRVSQGAQLLKWPREAAEKYGPPFLFSLFAGILVWEEVWDLPHSAYLSGWLLILITAGAVICSSIWERRLWCRYLCPIGGMNGLFAKLSMTEVRARHGVCSGECTTYHCYKGGCAQPPDGLESPGCPLYSHPAQLADNRNCVNCMECLKACPNGSVEFRLRLPGTDLWSGHTVSAMEVALMFMLQGAVYLHELPRLVGQFGLDVGALGLEGVTPAHMAASALVLAAPGLAAWGADAAGRSPQVQRALDVAVRTVEEALAEATGDVSANAETANLTGLDPVEKALAKAPGPPAPFLALSYGYLPLVWATTLSYYLKYLLGEGGEILKITAASVGWENAPVWAPTADPAVIAFVQGSTLLFGAAASAAMSRKLAGQPWSAFLPQLACIGLFTAEAWHLIMY
ncbi:hypothetical protein HYH03_007267 [Edaphochlamys debaryana]|uniref:Nitrogen assimilation regulatory protein n=1 Tax=Edaphochlamys debaryana TaxID=47281 RepID=A0A835Y4D0_9CHLO|nr:hypothetical protein HYH03_007267 [Edaphochlamys debaryana]|eukprot:KAG2494498.1 hypothetical protein HYH03_007267 [Edaphochlamys debaryana]